MNVTKTDIIPVNQTFVHQKGAAELHWEAICFFAAVGFFPETDTYYKNQQVLPPGSENIIDKNNYLQETKPWFEWYYKPRDISFEKALDEFTRLFETIIAEQVENHQVILPLSGGLDSRTQAVALKRIGAKVQAYSYSFSGGYPEYKIAAKIAKACNFPFTALTIPYGYLWDHIETLATLNNCYTDFTHPRQMAVLDQLKSFGTLFSLGHWGDVLFDNENLGVLSHQDQVQLVIKKIVKKGGKELAEAIWKEKELPGTFYDYLTAKISSMLQTIKIEEPNARIRAFKSKYWAPRWTSVNLAVFEAAHPISLPYYDKRMCDFICTLPEAYLANRQLQIAYIKKQAPALAAITWQDAKPFNLYNAHLNKVPYNLPYRIANKLKRELNNVLGKNFIRRNWELQFTLPEHQNILASYVLSEEMNSLLSKELVMHFLTNFKEKDTVYWSHPVSMLLTLSLFAKKFNS